MNNNGRFKNKKVPYSQVSNYALRDQQLSLKAKGLYALIQSYITIENFILYKTTLIKACKEKETAFQGAWNELKKAGYLKQYKCKNDSGYYCYEYELLDISELQKLNHTLENPCMDNPQGGKSGAINKNDINNNNKKPTIKHKRKFKQHEEIVEKNGKPECVTIYSDVG